LWYHETSPLGNTKAANRWNYYPSSRPYFIVDGTFLEEYYSTSDVKIRNQINLRKALTPPITISIASSCPSLSGNATVTIKNTSSASISGTLQFIVKERRVTHSWSQGFVDNAVRDMVPNEKGEAVTINAGETITKNRAFTLTSAWKKDSCKLVAFVQKSDKEIIEGCIAGVNQATQIVTGDMTGVEPVRIRACRKSVVLYVPEKGKTSVSIMDIRGREIADFSIISYGGWVQLPEINWCGIVLLHIKTARKTYREKIQVME